jgi:HAD superfamily hydrolase (TIGR01509 family)
MVKTVIFDLGKVLVDFDYGIAERRIAARGRVKAEEVSVLLCHGPLLPRYETGLLTSAEFFREVCAATGFAGDIAEFVGCFGEIFSPIAPMIELQAQLRRRGVPTYVFSNTNEMALAVIQRDFPFLGNFDGHIYSFEHGAMKPSAKLYEVVEKQSGCRGGEILYIDDRAENVEAGAARGWQAILQETPENTIARVRESGLL